MGAPSGMHVANLANGEWSFARVVDHASVEHGIGVATGTFGYD